jgi:hypothetical protein
MSGFKNQRAIVLLRKVIKLALIASRLAVSPLFHHHVDLAQAEPHIVRPDREGVVSSPADRAP